MITIATSIMPRRIEAQQKAINSWLKLGFNVVSVNLPGEVDHLHAQFLGVDFVETAMFSSSNCEGCRVPLSYLLSTLSAISDRIGGIVNSDIIFRAGVDFVDFIENNAIGGMIYGSRIDIDNSQPDLKREDNMGFDYFFFDKSIIPLLPENDFYLGLPFWDYFLPMAFLAHSITVKRLISPVAFHILHTVSWNQFLDPFRCKFFASIKSLLSCNIMLETLSDRLMFALETNNEVMCSEVSRFILRYAVPVLIYKPNIDGQLAFLINIGALEDMKVKLLEYDRIIAENQRIIAEMQSSKSWRLTSPFRSVNAIFRKIMR